MGPAALAKLQRFMLDSRDERPARFLELVNSGRGVWGCDTLTRCIDACPKEVRPTDAIVGLRKTLVKYRMKRAFGLDGHED
jgi:succinate dehydrogenase / fumarate reductase iron-sulfur subunit